MRVAVNLRLYVKGKIGGMENYVRHVMAGISVNQAKSGDGWTVFAHRSEAENVRELCLGANIIPVVHETATGVIREELNGTGYDVLFCPLLALDPMRPGIPSAVTIPDLQHEFYPEYFDADTLKWRRESFQASASNADIIFTLSQFSKRTIADRLHADPNKIVVVDLAADPEFHATPSPDAEAAWRDLRLCDDYVYYPANYWRHKNHSALLQALKLIHENGRSDLGLVLTGATEGVERIRKEIATLGLRKSVRILPYQSRGVIAEIHRHARALVFVSRFEGFGIPVVEAFHTGTPVVSSKACSLPEVAGDAALFVDETSPQSIAAGICRVLDDGALRKSLVDKGTERARMYDWSRAVDLTLESLERIAHTSNSTMIQVDEYPTVSVVTPSLNMGRFLEETIQSVLGQDYPHIEYCVMDGDSTDGTQDILRKYEGKLRYRSGKDGGQASAINRGFAESSGEVFAYLNADDTYLPGAVGTAVGHLRANRNAGAVYGEAYYTTEDGGMAGRYPTERFDYERLNRNCFICQPAAFMTREAFAGVGGMNDTLHYAPDYDLWIRMAQSYPLFKVDDYLATSRMHQANKTLGSRRRIYKEIISLAKKHFAYVPYDWTFGFASYMLNRGAGFFEQPRATPVTYLVTLALGLYYNPRQMGRYGKEWATQLGIGAEFTGRWSDGWISKRYLFEKSVPGDCVSIRLTGRHIAPFRSGLSLAMSVNGRLAARIQVRQNGSFTFETECPPGDRGNNVVVELRSSKTFRPVAGGDYRKLSCLIDTVEFVCNHELSGSSEDPETQDS
jgi:glycosyltransferase involved in cell wall biosynthesis